MKFTQCLVVMAAAAGSMFAADAGLLKLAPADTKVVGGIYVDRTRNTPFGQFVLSQVQEEDANFRSFISSTGFDPRRDLNEVLLFSNSTVSGSKHTGLVAARGVFNGPQILAAAAKAGGGAISTYNGVQLLADKSGKHTIAILDGAVGLAGDAALVKAAIDQRQGSSALSPQILAKVNELSGQYDAWFAAIGFVAPFSSSVPQTNMGAAARANALQAIEQTSGGVKFGALVQVAGEAIARSDKDAQSLADVIRFFTGFVALSKDRDPNATRLAALLESMNLTTQGNAVRLSFSVPESDLEQILKSKGQNRRAAVR